MNLTSKAAVARLLKEVGLEGLPAHIYDVGNRPSREELVQAFGSSQELMLRTHASQEFRNLPRRAGLKPEDAAKWIRKLPPSLGVIVQPYDEVVFSVEVAIYTEDYVAELIPGIWELGSNLTPATIYRQAGDFNVTWPIARQLGRFHDMTTGYHEKVAGVADWHISSVVTWIRENKARLEEVHHRLSGAFGIKLHYAATYGLSPQNIRTNLPPWEPQRRGAPPVEAGYIGHIDDAVPLSRAVTLDVSIARESHQSLDKLISRMAANGVGTVYLRSGLLSHLAISIREAGFIVRRFDG